MTVYRVQVADRTFFVASTNPDTARALVIANYPEIEVTEEPRSSADGDAP